MAVKIETAKSQYLSMGRLSTRCYHDCDKACQHFLSNFIILSKLFLRFLCVFVCGCVQATPFRKVSRSVSNQKQYIGSHEYGYSVATSAFIS